jgi:hypothetical protein
MSASAALAVHSFKVGKRTVTMTMQKPEIGGCNSLAVEWHPDTPSSGLSKRELRQYRAGRAVLAELVSEAMGGGRILIIET